MTFGKHLEELAIEAGRASFLVEKIKRAAEYPSNQEGNYICPYCWVDFGEAWALKSVGPGPDDTEADDHFRCSRNANHEFSWPA